MMKWINKKRNKKGFTLVELVVVIAILGILAGIAVPKLSGSRETAKLAAHNANVRTLKSTAMMHIAENPNVGNVDITEAVLEYIDGKEPIPYGGGFFRVKINGGNVEVTPGEDSKVAGESTSGKAVTTP